MQAKVINQDIKAYEKNNVSGVIACGSQRSYFPNGLPFYTYARTMFDTSLSYEEILEDYYSHLYGDSWKQVHNYLSKLFDALPFEFFSRDMASGRENVHFDIERAEKIKAITEITKNGRELIKSLMNSEYRVQNASLHLLLYHADFCDLISAWMCAKAKGEITLAKELLEKARINFGKYEKHIEDNFDHNLYFGEYFHTQNLASPCKEDIVSI